MKIVSITLSTLLFALFISIASLIHSHYRVFKTFGTNFTQVLLVEKTSIVKSVVFLGILPAAVFFKFPKGYFVNMVNLCLIIIIYINPILILI